MVYIDVLSRNQGKRSERLLITPPTGYGGSSETEDFNKQFQNKGIIDALISRLFNPPQSGGLEYIENIPVNYPRLDGYPVDSHRTIYIYTVYTCIDDAL